MSYPVPSVRQRCRYDPDLHYAPPIRIQWMTRSKELSTKRWVFAQCCGQTEKVKTDENGRTITSLHPCKLTPSINVTEKHHSGKLRLLRITFSCVRKRAPNLAVWDCCGASIPRWDDSWDSRDGKIPFEYVNTGCQMGHYIQAEEYDDDDDDDDKNWEQMNPQIALVARPLVTRRSKPHSQRSTRSGPSSGTETVVLEQNKMLKVDSIEFSQNSAEQSFSNGTPIIDTAVEIVNGVFIVFLI